MAYRAEIEIGVRGTRELERLRSLITQSTQAFESLNRIAAKRGGLNQTLDNYETQLVRAKRAIDNVTAGTQAEVKAIREYVTAMGLANAARDRQNYLIAQEVANRRRVQATINAGFGQQGAALPPSMRNAGFGQQGPALAPAAARRAGGGAAATLGGGRVGGIVSNAVIGGAFPLLFGQGGAAATGGALGGIVGGAFGGAGGFAGSLLGTLLGRIAGQANQVKELAADIGFSAQQTQLLGIAFKQAGADFDKFAESVSRIQGVGLALEEQASAIQLASTLTEAYGGRIDKVTNAFTNALQTGKVTQATLNQLTSQGIPIQDALAAKYNVSRDALLQMAKDGKISVQDLLDTLVNLANESSKGPAKISNAYKEAFDEISLAVDNLTKKLVDSFNFQSESAGKAGENLAYRVSGAFTQVLQALEPVLELLAQTSGAFVNLGVQAVNALSGIPNMIGSIANAIIGMIPGLGSAYSILSLTANLTGKGRKPGVATPLNLNQGMGQNWPAGVPRPGTPSRIQRIMAPAQMPASAAGSKSRKSAADRAAQEALELAATLKQLREQLRIETKSLELQEAISFARADGNEKLVAFLQTQEKFYNIDEKASKLREDFDAGKIKQAEFILRQQLLGIERKKVEITEEERLNAVLRERYQITAEVLDAARRARENAFGQGLGGAGTFRTDVNLMPGLTGGAIGTRYEELRLELQELTKLSTQVITAAEGIGEAFGNSFKGMITGAMTAQDALSNFFSSLADYFADMATRMIAKWLEMQIIGLAQSLLPGSSLLFPQGVGNFSSAFGAGGPSFNQSFAFGGFRAAGGPVRGATPYVVGERGPELFVPGSSGSIVPNNQLGSMGGDVSVVVNVDANGSQVQGNENQAKALGGAISAAVQAEIVKQQRPGGLLAGTR